MKPINILVTGAQFGNKGAQSLLFTLISEVTRKFGDNTVIYYMPLDNCLSYPNGLYKFKLVFDANGYKDVDKFCLDRIKKFLIDTRKKAKVRNRSDIYFLEDVWDTVDIMLDISGYTLASDHSRMGVRRYLRRIDEAKKHNVKVVLLPQSFGPFDYSNDDKIFNQMRNTLKKADLIFAREEEGVELLKTKIGLCDTVRYSTDLVLQSRGLSLESIYTQIPDIGFPIIETKNNVGIIPNRMLLTKINEEKLIEIYKAIVQQLQSNQRTVYIFRHSNDLELCEKIFDEIEDKQNVYLLKDDMDCIAYSYFIKQFDFIIASRYHSIVHAYREEVPVISLGWAIKYQELAEHLNQSEYVFDIDKLNASTMYRLSQKVDSMCNLYEKEKHVIRTEIEQICRVNCFDECWKVLQ